MCALSATGCRRQGLLLFRRGTIKTFLQVSSGQQRDFVRLIYIGTGRKFKEEIMQEHRAYVMVEQHDSRRVTPVSTYSLLPRVSFTM